jgi:hypothetical protein
MPTIKQTLDLIMIGDERAKVECEPILEFYTAIGVPINEKVTKVETTDIPQIDMIGADWRIETHEEHIEIYYKNNPYAVLIPAMGHYDYADGYCIKGDFYFRRGGGSPLEADHNYSAAKSTFESLEKSH